MNFLPQALTAQANRVEVPSANPIRQIGATRVREFLRMNPPVFLGCKVDEDSNRFIDEVCNVLAIMGCIPLKRRILVSIN